MVNSMLAIVRRYVLPNSCRHCWLVLAFIFAMTCIDGDDPPESSLAVSKGTFGNIRF